MKRITVLFMVIILSYSFLLAACNNNGADIPQAEEGIDSGEENSSYSDKGVFPITKDKTTLNIMIKQHTAVLDYEDNDFTKFLEEKTNVHIDWTIVPEADWQTKINLLLASASDLPDIIMGGLTFDQLAKYGRKGYSYINR